MSVLFSPLTIRGMTTKNRIVMSPMLLYMAGADGRASDLHLVHYGARILGGVGLVVNEVTAVTPEGRISDRDLGLWHDDQIDGLKRITDFAHRFGAVIGIQLAHAGRKSSLDGNVAPSASGYQGLPVARELTVTEIDDVVEKYRAAARRAVTAGYDCVELHIAHGYLLHEFLSPHTNRRNDAYGGSLENRVRLPLRIVEAVRDVIPTDMPLLARLTGEDFLSDGVTIEESLEVARNLAQAGVDLFDMSTANITHEFNSDVYPGYQAEYARRVKRELGVLTAAMGGISSPELAEYLVSSGTSDLVFVGRALMRDPNWARQAANLAGVDLPLSVPTYARATGPWERGF